MPFFETLCFITIYKSCGFTSKLQIQYTGITVFSTLCKYLGTNHRNQISRCKTKINI